MCRLTGLAIWGLSRVDPHVERRVQEKPAGEAGRRRALAIPTIVLGALLGLPFGDGPLHRWLEGVFAGASEALPLPHAEFALFGIDGVLILVSVAAAAVGIAVAWKLFGVELLALRKS